jgi:hypothetical protein
MHEREYKKLRKQIEEEYQDNLRALDLVWKRAGKNGVSKRPTVDDSTLAALVRSAVERTSGPFTIRDILGSCNERGPRDAEIRGSSVSAILKRMADHGTIGIVEVGSGRRPTSYKKP